MGKEGTTPLLFLFHLPLSCLLNLRSYFSQHLGRPAVLPCQQHLLLLHGQAARSVHGERLPEKGCPARLSSTTCTIAVTALNPAGHISPPLLLSSSPELSCLFCQLGGGRSLLQQCPVPSMLSCSRDAACPEPTQQLLVWMWASADYMHTHTHRERETSQK